MRFFVYFFIWVCTTSIALAKTNYTLVEPEIVAVVNDWSIPEASLDVFYEHVRTDNQAITKHSLLDNIIESRLVALHALETIGEQTLSDESSVGFKQSVANQDQLIGILKTSFNPQITKSIKLLNGGTFTSVIKQPLSLTQKELQEILSLKGRMEYKLTTNQMEIARNTRLIKFQFPNQASSDITLWDIYERTNIQEKIALQRSDISMLKSLIQRRLSNLYIFYWVKHHSIIGDQELEALQQFIHDNRVARQYHLYEGSISDVHHDNKGLRRMTKNVTQEEVDLYYQSHKEEFKSTLKVKARHLRINNQALADQVYAELKDSLDFKDAVIKYSIAEDKSLASPGDMGWIDRKDKTKSWLTTLPFIPSESGVFTAPFKSPITKGKHPFWEIIFVDERVTDYYPADSKTVHYAAAKLIAKQKIARNTLLLKTSLMADAVININASFTGQAKTSQHSNDLNNFYLFKKEHSHNHDDKQEESHKLGNDG